MSTKRRIPSPKSSSSVAFQAIHRFIQSVKIVINTDAAIISIDSFQNLTMSRFAFFIYYQFIINPLVMDIDIPVEIAAPTIPKYEASITVATTLISALNR